MSQRFLPFPSTEFALDFGPDFDFKDLLIEKDTTENKGPMGQATEPFVKDSFGESLRTLCLNNPLYVQSSGKPNTPKLEEWQLVPDDVLWYWDLDNTDFTDRSETQQEAPFFNDIAKELQFCREKLDEIKESYKPDRKQRCASAEIPSDDSSPISWCSQSFFSLDCDFFDLPGFSQQNEQFEPETKFPTQNNGPQGDPSNTSFTAVSPIEGNLSSYESINALSNLSQFEENFESIANNGEVSHSISPRDFLAPYTGEIDEDLFFSLVQDFSLDSPILDDEGTPNTLSDKPSELIDRQPQAIQLESELACKEKDKAQDQGVIYISNDSTADCKLTDITPPAIDCQNRRERASQFHFEPTNKTGGDFHNKLEEKKSSISNEKIKIDKFHLSPVSDTKVISASYQVKADNKHGEGDITRQKKWWSSDMDKKDINFLKVPFVSVGGLVFHGNQNGAIKVGEGSFGTVFLADLYIGGAVYQVVVKDFSPKGVTKPAEILEEARVLMHLSDTMFIPYFYGLLPVATPQQFAIVQEYFARGTSLHNILEDKSVRLSSASWISLCVQLAVGLDRFHRKGILMNDIKKDNILVDCRNEDCVLRYIDMGLASFKTGRVFYGSEEYMQQFSHLAPEVRRLEKTTPASDVYSIGKILTSIAKYAPLRQIRDMVSPCLSHSPLNRPHLHEIICQLITIRDHIYKSSTFVPPRQHSVRRWFC